MKICVTASGPGLDASLDPRVGRCAYFVIVNTETMTDESISNTSAGAAGGAGIQAAQTIISTGASALITGNAGPNAAQTLSAAGVKIYLDQGGSVRDAVERFKRGELKEISSASAPPHAGMGGGRGMGDGGRGMGGGGRGSGGQ
ncbi:MAG: NifB/NifX family molybdenum-iron cluster-binding protein [Methanotrichaceae archaeon]